MRERCVITIVLVTLLLGCASACNGRSSEESSATDSAPPASSTSQEPGETRAARPSQPRPTPRDFDASLFDDTSYVVDHKWFPLEPGTRYVWEGRAFDDEGERIERRVIFVVTDLTKTIGGVRAIVGWDRDFDDGLLGESELIFYAQDKVGNVWHLGEYVEHWDDGKELDGGRYWGVGFPEGAQPGVQMYADPEAVTSNYSQGFVPRPWFWHDRARVADVGVRDCVPAVGCSGDAIVIEEFEPRFRGAFQLKYYAPGVGNTRVGWRGDDEEQEEMVLTEFTHLDADAMAKVRAEVLEQEERGLSYGRTEPAAQINP